MPIINSIEIMNKMKTKFFVIALAVLTIGLLGSCQKEDPTVSVMGVTLDKTTLTLTEGDNAQLVATVKPDNATDKSVSWISNNPVVAAVNSKGNVVAATPGEAIIYVTTVDGAKTASCKVTVLENIDGALPGLFSVSDTRKVRFSQGNLQAIFVGHAGISYSFRFAENQYDCIGDAPGNTTIDESWDRGVVDLFGWSTDSNTLYGINTSTDDSDYSGNFRDWGNKIGDGNTWRTLSWDEWKYLFYTRTVNGGTGKDKSYSLDITYGGIMGLVLYPDDYTGSVLSGTVDSLPEGVVFLPAAGSRYGSNVRDVGAYGYYWSSADYDSFSACHVYFLSDGDFPDTIGGRDNGYSVRLITECQ